MISGCTYIAIQYNYIYIYIINICIYIYMCVCVCDKTNYECSQISIAAKDELDLISYIYCISVTIFRCFRKKEKQWCI